MKNSVVSILVVMVSLLILSCEVSPDSGAGLSSADAHVPQVSSRAVSQPGSSSSRSASKSLQSSVSSYFSSSASQFSSVSSGENALNQVYTEQMPDGRVRFSIRVSAACLTVHCFAQNNQVQNVSATDIQTNVVTNTDNTYTYYLYSPVNYQEGDSIRARFFAYSPFVSQSFYPGPTDAAWSTPLIYSAGSSSSSESSSEASSESSSEGPVVPRDAAAFDPAIQQGITATGKMPLLFDNNSRYRDDEIYIAICRVNGEGENWVDVKTGQLYPISEVYNTMNGYADIFTKLSDVPGRMIPIPKITSAKVFISFKKPLKIKFHPNGGAGYAPPDLNNPNDPSAGIRFEVLEYSWAPNGIWINTSRVDAYQYAMALEVWGSFNEVVYPGVTYRKIGELLKHEAIISRWNSTVSPAFRTCYKNSGYDKDGIIEQPSKITAFKAGGAYQDYFKPYIDAIWDKYTTNILKASLMDLGVWQGGIENGALVMRDSKGNVGRIAKKPTTAEVIEGSGVMASGTEMDLNVQKFVCASINRHAIDLTAASGVQQDWKSREKYFLTPLYNEYVAFWHNFEVSYNSETYAFCYDDVYEHSSTIQCNVPQKARVIIGGFYGINQ